MKNYLLPVMLLLFSALLFNACQKDQLEPQLSTVDSVKNLKGTTIEALSKSYFESHPKEAKNQDKLLKWTNIFLNSLGNNEAFTNKLPCFIQAIYAYGIEGVAYYEVWFTEDDKNVKGWVLISATDRDSPVVNFSDGTPYSSRMLAKASPQSKVYRFGVSYFTTEVNGQKVAEYGQMPSFISNPNSALAGEGEVNTQTGMERHSDAAEPVEGVDYYTIDSYESLKQLFPANYYTDQLVLDAKEMADMLTTQSLNRNTYTYRWTGGDKAFLTQIPANDSANNTNCWSGCNNNAWTNVYAWWDKNKSKSNLIPTTGTGEVSPLFRNTIQRQASIDPVQMSIRASCGTYCSGGGGWTYWKKMHKGYLYAASKGYGYNYHYKWCNSKGCDVLLANITTEGIANRREEMVIGANSHMYVGYAWAQDPGDTNATWAYCYPGWNTNNADNVWIWWKKFNATTRITVY